MPENFGQYLKDITAQQNPLLYIFASENYFTIKIKQNLVLQMKIHPLVIFQDQQKPTIMI